MKKNMMRLFAVIALLGVWTACEKQSDDVKPTPDAVLSASVDPIPDPDFQAGEAAVECAQVCDDCDGGYKVDEWDQVNGMDGTYNIDAYGNTITISNSNGSTFDWSSNLAIGYVIVKAATGANIYAYDPPAKGDTKLVAYQNKEISHVTFCWQYTLDVSKTAETHYKRTYDWKIYKMGDVSELTLAVGQTLTVNYDVTVEATYKDSDFMVKGKIEIKNNTPVSFTVEDVNDYLEVTNEINATVSCTLPKTLAPGESLTCDYEAAVPDASDGTNTAIVKYFKTEGKYRTATATADVIFGKPTKEIDECIDVTDDKAGALGKVCFANLPKTFEYTLDVKYDVCGEYEFINTASFVTNDNGVTGSDSWTINVSVPCGIGCTLTRGYWQTHSEFGPAPYDDNWENLPDGASTTFFLSGQTYYEVLWTPPAGGNVYYVLAPQWIAAYLNVLNGASIPPDVLAAWTDAQNNFFNKYTPAQAGALKGAQRNKWIAIANLLDQYNNGLIGPGHCDE